MKIEFDTLTINLEEVDSLVNLLRAVREKLVSDEHITPHNAAPAELAEEIVNDFVHKMHEYALSLEFGKSFKATELYRAAVGGKWIDLSANTRKAIGRQFKKMADEFANGKSKGDTVIEFKDRNIQNTAIYHVVQKEKGPI